MTRLEFLQLVVRRARANGFEFRRWYTTRLGVAWISQEAALALLDTQRRYYAMIYSHEFAQTFWKPGSEISFDVPHQTFQRIMPDGTIRTVQRKPYVRRSLRPNAWRYHLRQMALAEDPLRYLRKYLHIEEDLDREASPGADDPPAKATLPKSNKKPAKKRAEPRPMPTEMPAFLQRKYRPSSQ